MRHNNKTSDIPRCGKCGRAIYEDDNFCRYCGAERCVSMFTPENNMNCCVYGPPVTISYKCGSCDYSWSVDTLIGTAEARFCPKCGGVLEVSRDMKI